MPSGLLEASVTLDVGQVAATDAHVVGRVRGMRIHGVELTGIAHGTGETITVQVKSAVPLPTGIFKDQLIIDWSVDRALRLRLLGMVWTMLAPLPVQPREAWDDRTAAAMRRVGVPSTAQRLKPGTSQPRGDGFRVMEIVHIYDDEDRCH